VNLLAIETATTRASVALKVADQYFVAEEPTLTKHAEWVLEAIRELLNRANVTLNSMNGIVFDEGPGSFTGLRIACSIAKGLAMGAQLSLYPVSSLEAIALGAQSHPQLLSVIDARMNAWYWGRFEAGKRVGNVTVSHPGEIDWPEANAVWLAGVGFEDRLEDLPPTLRTKLIGYETVYPTAERLLLAVAQGHIAAVSAEEARPNYVRQRVVN
jgi:tRNA threonylcarbamoyladenosine biosynthesis protein TsaB